MRIVLVFLIFSITQSISWAHPFYFAFAEMEYNTTNQRIEISIEATAHDVSESLADNGILVSDWKQQQSDTSFLNQLNPFFTANLLLVNEGQPIACNLLGYEIKPTGQIYFFLQSEQVVLKNTITITFPLLMETFEEQQNKLLFSYNNTKYNAVFLQQSKTTTLQFS